MTKWCSTTWGPPCGAPSLRGTSRISKEDVDEVVKEIQRSLLSADVEVSLVMELSDSIRSRALDEEPPAGTGARDHVLRIVYEALVDLVGDSTELPLEPQTVMLVGLQGSGKTTTAAKIGWWFETKGLRSAVVQTDTFRPGAYEQAEQMAGRAELEFYGEADSEDPVGIAGPRGHRDRRRPDRRHRRPARPRGRPHRRDRGDRGGGRP